MQKPLDFVGVAAAKSGTSWLHACLAEHPEVFLPELKELDYFSTKFSKGTSYLNEFFRDANPSKLWGEFSPSYAPNKTAHKRLYEHNPKIKLIWILRDPVERAYSHYCMACRSQNKILDVEEILSLDSDFVRYGEYGRQLDEILELFPLEQQLVLRFEDIGQKKSAEALFKKTLSFLEVEESFRPSFLNKKVNSRKNIGRYPKLFNALKGAALAAAAKSKVAAKAVERFRQSSAMTKVHELNSSKQEFMPLKDELRKKLEDHFQKDQERLQTLLQKNG